MTSRSAWGRTLSNGEKADILFFIADAEDDWKAITPTLPDRPVITVTLTATDPEGLSASVAGDFVIWWESYPEVVRARADGAVIELTFDWAVESDPAPAPEQFTVHVVNEDGTTGTIEVNSVSVNGKVVTLDLASALDESQTVTLNYAYNYPDDTPLQRAGGGDAAPGFTGLAVAFLQPPGEPANFAVSATPGQLNLLATWDEADGATSYKLRWRQAGGEFEADNAATVTDAMQFITVSDYGQWEVRLQACNDAGCGPEASQTVEVAPTALTPPANFAVTAEPGEKDVSATWDALDGATSYRLRWRPAGGEFEAANTTTVTDANASITVSDYGQWEVRLQACNDDGCGTEASGTVEVVVPAVWLNLALARDAEGQVRPRTITASWDPVPDAVSYTLRWWPAGPGSQAQTQPDGGRQSRAASGPSGAVGNGAQGANRLDLPAGQTSADFIVPDDGEYRTTLQARNAKNELIAQGDNEADQADDPADTTPPRLVRGEVDGKRMTFYFSEALDEAGGAGADFYVIQRFSVTTIRGSQVSGNRVTVDFWGDLRAKVGERIQAYYIIDDRFSTAEERIRDLAGNEVWTPYKTPPTPWPIPRQPRTRTIQLDNLTAPAALERATVRSRWLTLTFDETLNPNSVPAASAFTVTVDGSAVSLDDVEPVIVDGSNVVLVLAAPASSSDVALVSYRKPSSNPLRGWDGPAASFSNQAVTNLVGVAPSVSQVAITSTPAANSTYVPGETIRVRVTFTEAVTVDTTGGTPRLRIMLAPDHGTRWADYASGSGATTLEFAYTVLEPDRSSRGVAVLHNPLDLNGGAIRSLGMPPTDAHLWFAGLDHDPNHQVDGATPALWRAAMAEATKLILSYNRTLDEDSAPPASAFTVKVGSSAVSLASASPVAVAGDTVALTLAAAVAAGDTVTVSYAKPAASDDRLKDAAGNEAASFADRAVASDSMASSLWNATATGSRLTLRYHRFLDGAAVPPASAFTVKKTPPGGSEETASLSGSPTISGGVVRLTLAAPVDERDQMTVSYAKPTSGSDDRIRDRAGNEAASFTDLAVHLTDTTPPRMVRGEIHGDVITIYFSEPMDEDSAGGYFRVNLQLSGKAGNPPDYGQCRDSIAGRSFTAKPREVFVSGNTVVVVGLEGQTTRAGVGREYNTVRYVRPDSPNVIVPPGTNGLQDLAGNALITDKDGWTRSILLENVTGLPSPERATVVGNRLTLIFDAPLDGGRTPPGSAFTVKVGGSAVSLASANPVSVSGHKVTLTLASPVAAGADVTVSYEKPSRRWLRNVICEYAKSFTDVSATNGTGAAPADVAITSDPGRDGTYGLGETVRLTLTFSQAVEVTGKPYLTIDLDPAGGGEKWARYESGSGTNSLTFARKVVDTSGSLSRDISTAGIAVLADSLRLNGGAIQYASSGKPAFLAHRGLGHDPNHKVDWRQPSPGVPWVTDVAITSDPGDDNTYGLGETIRVTLTFNEAIDVTGEPRLKIKMDPDWGEQWAIYEGGSGTTALTFAYTVAEPNKSPRGIAVLQHRLDLKGGAIRSAATLRDANLWYAGLPHNPSHKVDWQR